MVNVILLHLRRGSEITERRGLLELARYASQAVLIIQPVRTFNQQRQGAAPALRSPRPGA